MALIRLYARTAADTYQRRQEAVDEILANRAEIDESHQSKRQKICRDPPAAPRSISKKAKQAQGYQKVYTKKWREHQKVQ